MGTNKTNQSCVKIVSFGGIVEEWKVGIMELLENWKDFQTAYEHYLLFNLLFQIFQLSNFPLFQPCYNSIIPNVPLFQYSVLTLQK